MSASTEKKKGGKIMIVAVLMAAVIGVIAVKNRDREGTIGNNESEAGAVADSPAGGSGPGAAVSESLPTLIDLGAGKCIPCKMMAPILEELKTEYAGRMTVTVLDVWEDPRAGKKYGIRMIPTQIFFDAGGKELFRHEGFFSKEDILGKWKELGIHLDEKGKNAAPETEPASPSPVLPDSNGSDT